MKVEKTVFISGKQYQELKSSVDHNQDYEFNIGTDAKPHLVKVTDVYLDTDPEFTRNPQQYAKIHDDKKVQVRIEYEEE